MRRSSVAGALISGASAITLATFGPASLAAASPRPAVAPPLASVVSQTPVRWTPNVSADRTVGQESRGSGPACNATLFGGGNLNCQSEVYSTAYVNGDVIVAGAFTEACQPAPASEKLCAPGTQVARDDIFAYQAGTGRIDPHFKPPVNAGPVWSVVAGPAGSNDVYVGGAFSSVDGAKHQGIVELHVNPGVTKGPAADGSVVTGFRADVGNTVRRLALSPSGTALYAGGQFGSVDGVRKFANGDAVAGIARLNARTGALDTSFAFTLADPITGLAVKAEAISLSPDGDELAVSGTALEVNGQARPRLAVINTGGKLDAPSALAGFYAPILNDNCSGEHDHVRSVAFSPDGTFLVIGDTGYLNDGSQPYSACDAVARFNVDAGDTAAGTAVDVPPSWINYGGGDSFYSVAVAGNVVYAGGHDRWVNNYCGDNAVCEPNAVLVNGVSALDAHTGLALPWWHPQTLRGHGTMYLSTFAAGTYNGSQAGLALGTDVDVIGGAYDGENALFPLAATTSATPGGPIPSGMFNEEGGASTGTPMCAGDAGGAATAGTEVELSACANDAGQNWTVQPDGAIGISGLCLATAGRGTAAGTLVVLSACRSGTATQQWAQGAGNILVNKGATAADGKQACLDDPGSATAGGTQLDITACTGGQNQAWPLPTAQGPPSSPATGPVYPQEEQADTQVPCLDDASGGTATGNKVQLWTCRGDAEQQWTIEPAGTIRIDGSYCLDSSGGATAPGTAVVLDPCHGRASQVWTPGPGYSLVQRASGLCLDDPGADPGNGEQLQIGSCDGGNSQAWRRPAV